MSRSFTPVRSLSVVLVCVATAWALPVSAATTCESLSSLKLPNTTISVAKSIPAGSFVPEKPFALPGNLPVTYKDLPAFCRVAVHVTPAADSDIAFEIWMPMSGWNGKFVGVGNGGYSGEIWYPAMNEPLSRGYATASTNTGHDGSVIDASFAAGHPEKWTDFAYRAVHEMTLKSKAIIAAFYAEPLKLSYWNGCSTGGRQGLMSAQRFPADYDGIIAGAPANYMTRLSAQYAWVAQALHKEPASFIPANKLPALHATVVNACDARDGVKDGVLENPTKCQVDLKTLACAGADNASCFTEPQLEAVRRIYGASTNPRTKQPLYPGMALGSELGWSTGVGQVTPEPTPLAMGIFAHVVFKNPNWNYRTFDFDKDTAVADQIGRAGVDAIDPNLEPFFDRGGKLLQYHGWADPGISPQNSIDYYTSVQKTLGASKVADSYRLFMMPGMDHCRGGEGPDTFDALGTLDAWMTQKKAPDRIVASRIRGGKADRTRPLCAYPHVAVYTGKGSTDDAANFVCRAQ